MSEGLSRHPPVETMAAFVEGALTPAETSAVADHLQECDDCRTLVAGTAQFDEEESSLGRGSRRWMPAAAAVLIAVVALALLIPPRNNDPASILVDALPKEYRRVDARVSGFPWAPFQAQQRGSGIADPADLKLNGAAGVVLEQTAKKNDAESLHAQGIALLLIDRLQDSITTLERAANVSQDAHVWNDLAAARYALVVRDERPSQLPLALAAADRALQLDSSLAEAHFNRALVLQRMGLLGQARKEWQSYLALDSSSEWSLEARAHLRALDGDRPAADFNHVRDTLSPEALVRQFPQRSRTWAEGLGLAEWAGDITASAKLDRIRAIGAALAASSGEHLLADAVAAIDRADADGRTTLAEAHRTYAEGRLAFNKRNPIAAEEKFRRAQELFRRGRSPMEHMAAVFAASAAFHQNRIEEAHGALQRIAQQIDGRRYRALTAQLHWDLAIQANINGDWGTAVRESAAAAQIYGELRERAYEAEMRVTAAPALDAIGEIDLAWKERLAALDAVPPRTWQNVLHAAAEALAARGEVAAAASVLDAVIAETGEDNRVLRAIVLGDRARLAARSGDARAAKQWLDEARQAAQLSDPALRKEATMRLMLAEAVVQTSVTSSDRAIAFFAAHQHGLLLPDAHLQRARMHRLAGNDDAALADYAAALVGIEQQQQSVADRGAEMFDTAGEIVDETIALRLARGEITEAFRVADRVRTSSDASLRAPHGAAVLEYAVLPEAIAVFCLTESGLSAAAVPARRSVVGDAVTSFAHAIRRRAPLPEVEREGAPLYRWLIAPVRGRLANATELVIVPDRELYGVPFAALVNPQSGRYLAEDFTIRFATSARAFENESTAALRPAFVVADPATPLPRLPYSREEARRIASLHDATLISGEDATPEKFVDAAQTGALIHFTGHADSNAADAYGTLLLAGTPGALGTSDIARLSLRQHPLVVLAACGTFRGDVRRVAGMPSLARAFLTAGARAVVGTLWEIDDDVSAALFFRFHEHLQAGASPATALRAAQLEMLQSPDPRRKHPASWSAPAVLSNQSGASI